MGRSSGKRLSVLHVTPYAGEAWAYGGIPRLSDTIARGLAARGHAVTICTTDACDAKRRLRPSSATTTNQPWPPVRTPDNVVVRVFPNVSNRLAHDYQCFLPIGLSRFLRQHAASFDVAHLHACRNVPGAIAARYLHAAGVPYLLAPNGTAPNIERLRVPKQMFDLAVGRRMMRRAARVLAVTEAEQRQLTQLDVLPECIRVIPNPIELGEFTPPPQRGNHRRHLPTSGPLVVFLGKLTPRKRVNLLIHAFAELDRQDATLVVAGNDMGAGQAARGLAERLGVGSRTVFTGLVEGRERLDLLADADVVVYPSEHEIFGLVPLEALLAETPVIVADDSGCGEVITGTGGGLVVPGSVNSLRDALGRVLGAPEHWRASAKEAAVRVRHMYAPDAVCEQIEQLYGEMCGRPVMSHASGSGLEARGSGLGAQGLGSGASGVSFVVPAHNGAAHLPQTLASIAAQDTGRPIEIIVVEDQSTDGSRALLESLAATSPLKIVHGPGLGAAAALNAGIRAARHPIICQVDQDVVLEPDWTRTLVDTLDADRRLAAVQGDHATDPAASFLVRLMGLDLELRYATLSERIDHVCTGNTAYRADALHAVGLLDETLGYGYDNDLSYRLQNAGYRLGFCRAARSRHQWREGLAGYLAQQYGFGYGRVDVVARHPTRCGGDLVSPLSMMAHPVLMGLAMLLLAAAALSSLIGGPALELAVAAGTLTAGLALERAVAGVRAWRAFDDAAALAFPLVHLVRDIAWVGAIAAWLLRRVLRRPINPAHSMSARPAVR